MTIDNIANGESGASVRTKLNLTVTKVNTIAEGATVNATDAALRDRATHTGTQAISTVADLQTALDGKATSAQGALADTAVQPAAIATFVESDPTGITGADAITNIVSLTQAEYDDIATPDASTLFVVT